VWERGGTGRLREKSQGREVTVWLGQQPSQVVEDTVLSVWEVANFPAVPEAYVPDFADEPHRAFGLIPQLVIWHNGG
jgi:hypothetical protein